MPSLTLRVSVVSEGGQYNSIDGEREMRECVFMTPVPQRDAALVKRQGRPAAGRPASIARRR